MLDLAVKFLAYCHKVIWCLLCVCMLKYQGAKQRFTELEKKGKSLLQVRKIRQFEENFDSKEFPDKALEIYVEAHKLLEE